MAPADVSKKFGSVVRSVREARDIGLRELAAKIGISPTYLSQIERGEDLFPREDTIVAISKELSVEPELLLSLAGIIPKDVMKIYSRRPQLYAELIRATRHMPKNQLELVILWLRNDSDGVSRHASYAVTRGGGEGGGGFPAA